MRRGTHAALLALAAAWLWAAPALAQLPPGGALIVNQTPVQGGTTTQCLYITSTSLLGAQACASGSGTVTSVSVTTANGVSGSVATATTTPAITLTLGAITPTSVNGNTFTTGTGTLTLGSVTLNAGAGGTLGSNAFTSTAYAPIASPTFTGTVTIPNGGVFGTPTSVTLTNATGLPISTGLTGAGTGGLTALGVNVGSAGAFVTFNGALGTPASGVATNLTGTAAGLTAGNVTINANLTGPIASSGNTTSITSQTGTGTKFVVDNTPTLITPVIGAATGTSVKLGGSAMVADFADDKAGGDVLATRFNSSNGRFVIGIGGTSGTAMFGNNLVWSGSGNVWNYDKTAAAWWIGNLVAGSSAFYICASSGTAGAAAGTDTGTNCGFSITPNGVPVAGIANITAARGEFGFDKIGASGTAPGAGSCKLATVAGTNANTCKLTLACGTSATVVTIVDNVGAGC